MATHDIVVIGGGTAGLVTAAGAAALGARVALIERERLGGDCLWTGCVPSKALIAAARKRHLTGRDGWAEAASWMRNARTRVAKHDDPERFRAMGVEVIVSRARLAGARRVETDGRMLESKRIVIATGSSPTTPPIPGVEEAGYLTHLTAFEQETLPPRITMLGGGPIGLELAQTYARLGAKVTVLELLPEVLPNEDPEVGRFMRDRLVEEGITVRTGFSAAHVFRDGSTKVVCGANGERIAADELFVATGRRANTADLDAERAGVALERGAVRVNARLETTQRGVWAAGDVTGGLQFTHVADYMARIVVQNALTPLKAKASYRVVPWVTYTDPEVARVGMTEAQATALGERVEVFRSDFADLDRAIVDGATAGFAKIVTRRDGRILGATIVGRGAGELIVEVVLAMRLGVPLQKLEGVIHPYPTMSEIVKRTAGTWYRQRYGDTFRGRLLRRLVRWWL
ncbi:MAG TPA: FAD-dependent oxidoreductase [Gemmatimonadales bacterium]|nr:FAD-dependent oxidoreductase [Gemmatimonadales bacterium]